jgi:hypothetical protein
MHVREMISAHPDVKGSISEPLVACIGACSHARRHAPHARMHALRNRTYSGCASAFG